MLQVIIASKNPSKINAVKSAFADVFPESDFHFRGIHVASGVPDQPMSDAETHQGALNRVNNAKLSCPGADYYVGLEAGIENGMTFAWMVIESEKNKGESRSSSLMLPEAVTTKLKPDNELGSIIDDLFHTDNIKQKGGAISLFTNQLLTRSSVYHQALILALVPFLHQELFSAA